MKINVVDIKGKESGRTVDLPDELFGIVPNEHSVYLAVKQYLANQRQGTHSSKTRGMISGSTRKLKKQKGTGTARAGSIKNPLFRKGGRIFGPEPRDYSIKLNKKVKFVAKASALSDKVLNNNVVIVEDFTFDSPKTKEYISVLKNLGVESSKVIHFISDLDKNLYLSSRNLPNANMKKVIDMNTYEIIKANKVVFSESSIAKLKELYKF